jgi:hypothetical protein
MNRMFNVIYQLAETREVIAVMMDNVRVIPTPNNFRKDLVYLKANLDGTKITYDDVMMAIATETPSRKTFIACDWVTIDGVTIHCEKIRMQNAGLVV